MTIRNFLVGKRKEIMQRDGAVCRFCGRLDYLVLNHDDGDIYNNVESNLNIVCKKCFSKIHFSWKRRVKENRNARVIEMRKNKLEFSKIGKSLGISRQRAHQIYSRYIKQQSPLAERS